MLRSFMSGIAGLKSYQTKMDVIGNNVANVNTVGFKSSNVNFSDVKAERPAQNRCAFVVVERLQNRECPQRTTV